MTSAREIAAWHDFQAEECELENQWFAAVFHLCMAAVLVDMFTGH